VCMVFIIPVSAIRALVSFFSSTTRSQQADNDISIRTGLKHFVFESALNIQCT
jgi:hypothetical protein